MNDETFAVCRPAELEFSSLTPSQSAFGVSRSHSPVRQTAPRVGLVGVSGYAASYWQILSRLDAEGSCDLRAVAIINPNAVPDVIEEVSRRERPIYPGFEEMLSAEADGLDLCCLPTSVTSHSPFTLAALAAGLDVLVEKPLATTLREAENIVAAARAADHFVAVGFQDLYTPATHRLIASLRAGRIGRVRRIRILGLWPRTHNYYQRNNWSGRVADGGVWILDSPVSNAFAHFLNLALCFAASSAELPARCIGATVERYRCQPIDTFDTVVASLDTSSSASIHLAFSHSGEEYRPVRLVIEGDAGFVNWTHLDHYHLHAADGTVESVPLGDEADAREHMFASVIARSEGDSDAFIFPAEAACEHLRATQAIHLAGPTHTPHPVARTLEPARTFVPGLDQWLTNASEQATFLSETGCPWAETASTASPDAFLADGLPPSPP